MCWSWREESYDNIFSFVIILMDVIHHNFDIILMVFRVAMFVYCYVSVRAGPYYT